ncbi:hypothetical protein M2277_001694 [Paenibacillus sp. LBL]|nr:hypothetical protein [Paenibacillus sp. LBL]MDH6671044.1 hypothetical protein [Paenibacillus sp. LBL]
MGEESGDWMLVPLFSGIFYPFMVDEFHAKVKLLMCTKAGQYN